MGKASKDRSHALKTTIARLNRMEDIAAGNIEMSVSPTTVAGVAGNDAWSREITCTLQNSSGDRCLGINGTFASKVAVAATATAGTVSVASADLVFADGMAVITVSGTAGTYAAGNADTVTISTFNVGGVAIAQATSREVFA